MAPSVWVAPVPPPPTARSTLMYALVAPTVIVGRSVRPLSERRSSTPEFRLNFASAPPGLLRVVGRRMPLVTVMIAVAVFQPVLLLPERVSVPRPLLVIVAEAPPAVKVSGPETA